MAVSTVLRWGGLPPPGGLLLRWGGRPPLECTAASRVDPPELVRWGVYPPQAQIGYCCYVVRADLYKGIMKDLSRTFFGVLPLPLHSREPPGRGTSEGRTRKKTNNS